MQEVFIPDSVKEIGNYAFYECPFMKTITLSEGLESIGNYAFDTKATFSGVGITGVVIPESVTFIGAKAFGDDLTSAEFKQKSGWKRRRFPAASDPTMYSVAESKLSTPEKAAQELVFTISSDYFQWFRE